MHWTKRFFFLFVWHLSQQSVTTKPTMIEIKGIRIVLHELSWMITKGLQKLHCASKLCISQFQLLCPALPSPNNCKFFCYHATYFCDFIKVYMTWNVLLPYSKELSKWSRMVFILFYFIIIIDTDEIPGFLLLLKNHIFTARSEDTIFIFHVWGYWCGHGYQHNYPTTIELLAQARSLLRSRY